MFRIYETDPKFHNGPSLGALTSWTPSPSHTQASSQKEGYGDMIFAPLDVAAPCREMWGHLFLNYLEMSRVALGQGMGAKILEPVFFHVNSDPRWNMSLHLETDDPKDACKFWPESDIIR